MRHILTFTISFIAGILLLNSCGEPYPEVIELDKFMYISLSGAIENPVIQLVDLNTTTTFPLHAFYGGTTNYNRGDISLQTDIDNSLIAAYNTEHNTSYLVLPDNAVSMDKTTLTIKNGERISDKINITINPQLVDFEYEYLLPVTIQSASGEGVPVNEELKTIYYVIQGSMDNYDWEKATWEIIEFSSEWNNDQFGIKNVIDGKKNTAWHSHPFDGALKGMPQWFIIDMKESRPAIRGFYIWNRQDDRGMEPKHVIFSVSEDKRKWTEVLDLVEMSNDQQNELDYKTTNPTRGQFLKVEVKTNWGNGDWTYFGEITPY